MGEPKFYTTLLDRPRFAANSYGKFNQCMLPKFGEIDGDRKARTNVEKEIVSSFSLWIRPDISDGGLQPSSTNTDQWSPIHSGSGISDPAGISHYSSESTGLACTPRDEHNYPIPNRGSSPSTRDQEFALLGGTRGSLPCRERGKKWRAG